MLSPQKVAGPAVHSSPFQQVRSMSTDIRQTFYSPKNSKDELMKKILVLLEENEKSALLIKQMNEKEENYKKRLEEVQQALEQKDKVIDEKDQVLYAQEEHMRQLLERNDLLTNQIRVVNKELEYFNDERVDLILYENEQLRDLNDRLSDQLSQSEEQLMKFKMKIDQLQSQETERNDYLAQLNQARSKIRNLEMKVNVLSQ